MINEKRNKIFDSKYNISENGCWLWKGYIDKVGYPQTSFRKSKLLSCRISAHRYSYERFKGNVPIGMHVCHDCPGGDNRICVNPDHLWIGTSLQNNRDKGKKGNQCKGETNGPSKLKEKQVFEIKNRLLSGELAKNIAIDFSICLSLVYHIKNGIVWSHLTCDSEKNKLKNIKPHRSKKLNEQNIIDIRRRYKNGEKVTDLSKAFNVETTMICRIKNGKAWKHVLS